MKHLLLVLAAVLLGGWQCSTTHEVDGVGTYDSAPNVYGGYNYVDGTENSFKCGSSWGCRVYIYGALGHQICWTYVPNDEDLWNLEDVRCPTSQNEGELK